MTAHSKPTQCDRLLRHMQEIGPITRGQAFDEYGVANITARISELRQAGHPVVDAYRRKRNRFGEKIKFKVYWIDRGQGRLF